MTFVATLLLAAAVVPIFSGAVPVPPRVAGRWDRVPLTLRETGITDVVGLTAVGFMALMFGPGREIRRAAKDRTILLLLPIGFEARVVAASSVEELRTVAADLQTTIGGLAPQE